MCYPRPFPPRSLAWGLLLAWARDALRSYYVSRLPMRDNVYYPQPTQPNPVATPQPGVGAAADFGVPTSSRGCPNAITYYPQPTYPHPFPPRSLAWGLLLAWARDALRVPGPGRNLMAACYSFLKGLVQLLSGGWGGAI